MFLFSRWTHKSVQKQREVDHTAHQLQTRGSATVNLKEKAEALRQQVSET